jgi:hypothetical protein
VRYDVIVYFRSAAIRHFVTYRQEKYLWNGVSKDIQISHHDNIATSFIFWRHSRPQGVTLTHTIMGQKTTPNELLNPPNRCSYAFEDRYGDLLNTLANGEGGSQH